MTRLIKLLNSGWDISIGTEVKRMVGDHSYREFLTRYVWAISKNTESGFTEIECEWEGFKTAKEAMSDLVNNTKDLDG